MASGDTKTEAMLNVLGNGGSGDEFRGCCNTKTQQYILDAIDRVQGVEDEVEELKNNPDVVDIVATYQDLQDYDTSGLTDKDIIRVLQDETHDGNSTYYRWNATTSQFDFVGEIAGGSGVTELTSADYNFHYSGTTDDGLAWWLLDDGNYLASPSMKVYYQAYIFADLTVGANGMLFTIMTDAGGNKIMLVYGEYKIDKLYAVPNSDPSVLYPSLIELYNVVTSFDVAQSTGTSTTKIMSQNATSSMIFADPADKTKVQIGSGASNLGSGVAIGSGAAITSASYYRAIALGSEAKANATGSVAIGAFSSATATGEFNIGTTQTSNGYNSSNYRLLTGLYDPQNAHDAATKGYVDGLVGNVASALNAINNGTGA